LKNKSQTEQQQKQVFHALSIFHEIKNTDQDKIETLNNEKENISTKKPGLKLIDHITPGWTRTGNSVGTLCSL